MTGTTMTSAQQFVKLPQYIVETTEGTFPTASPTFLPIGLVQSIELRKNNATIDVGQVGSEDLLDVADGLHSYQMTMTSYFSDSGSNVGSTFLKRFVNSVNWGTPAGTISESLSFLYSQYINGATENFIKISGARPKRCTLELSPTIPLKATYEFECTNISKPTTTSGLTTPTYAAAQTGPAWYFTSGGTNPFSWGSVTPNMKSINMTIERNTNPEPIIGQNNPYGTLPHQRQVTGTFTVLYLANEATTLETDYDGSTSRAISWVLKSSTSTLSTTDTKITNYSRTHAADDTNATIESIQYKAATVSVT